MIYDPVLTKHDFVRRYSIGEFGNRAPTWNSLDEMEESCVLEYAKDGDLFHVRNRIAGAETWYNILPEDLADTWYNACQKYGEKNLYISQMAPTPKTLFQGEVFLNEKGWNLFYSTIPKPMRDSLWEGGKALEGIVALSYLRYYLCPKSMDWLEILLSRYEGHVVEFSTYSECWGTLPGFNTVVWEVRRY